MDPLGPKVGAGWEVGSQAGDLCPGGSAGGCRARGRHILLWDLELSAD